MILGSHNSLTYLDTDKNFVSRYKCQEKTIEEQLQSGVHAFDIKIRFTWDNSLKITNGKWESKQTWLAENFKYMLLDIIDINRIDDEKIYIKFTLDTNFISFEQEINFIYFINNFNNHLKEYDNIEIYGGHRTVDDEKVSITIPDYTNYIITNKTVNYSRWYEKWFPKLFAKRTNEKSLDMWKNENVITYFDFI